LATHRNIKTLYLDTNIFNRPFDDQSQVRVRLETIAIFSILQRIKKGDYRLFWSFMIDFENSRNPYQDNRLEISMMSSIAAYFIGPNKEIRERGKHFEKSGIKPRDALHLACAVHAGADFFITCDDKLAKRAKLMQIPLQVYNPIDFTFATEVRQL
jgi:predicted nucleic acid-binding protein